MILDTVFDVLRFPDFQSFYLLWFSLFSQLFRFENKSYADKKS